MSPGRRFALLVGAAVLVGFGLRVAIGLTDDAPATDETAYLRSGISLVAGDGFVRGDRPELHFPPLMPFVLGSLDNVLDDPHQGTVVVTIVAGTLLVVPLALLARRLAGDGAGIATAWVAAIAPGLATTPSTRGAGSEALYMLLVVGAVGLVVMAGDLAGVRRALAAAGGGLLVGLAYLTRPEGLFFAVPLALALAYGCLRPARGGRLLAGLGDAGQVDVGAVRARTTDPDDGDRDEAGSDDGEDDGGTPPNVGVGAGIAQRMRRTAVVLAAFALPLVACVAPYVAFLHSHTGHWELTAKTQDASIEAWQAVARNDRQARDAVLYAVDESGFDFVAEGKPLPELARDDPAGYLEIVGTNVVRLFRNMSGWWLLPLPFWIVAGMGTWRLRRSAAPTTWLLLAVAAMPVATSLAFFVAPRYLLVTVALATIPIGVAVSSWTTRYRRPLLAVGAVLLAVGSVEAFAGPGGWWHPNDLTDQRRAGEWINAHTDPGDRIMTRSFVIDYYAERPTLSVPYAELDDIVAFGRHYGARYLVVDPHMVEKVRPQVAPLADDDSAPGLELVHEVTAEGRTTRIFAFVPAPPDPIGIDEDDIPTLGFAGDGFG
jgi:hypothetical protein